MVLVCLVIIVLLMSLPACSVQANEIDNPGLPGEITAQNTVPPVISITTTAVQRAENTATLSPTAAPKPTEVPEVRVFAPEYLKSNVVAATHAMELAGTSFRWLVVDTQEQADMVLVPGDDGIPAGTRAIAVTVPFSASLDEISLSQAESLASVGNADVVRVDWALMPIQRKALRIDGLLPNQEDYPLQQTWSLEPVKGLESAANELAMQLRNTLEKDRLVQLTAVGDLMLDRAIGFALNRGDLAFPFAGVAHVLQSADLTIGNLESALGDQGLPEDKRYTFQAPPVAARALSLAGFDLLSLANNHALDYGPEGMQQAIDLLQQVGIATVGAGPNALAARSPYSFSREGLTLAFLSYVDVPVEVSGFDTRRWEATEQEPGIAWADTSHIEEDVALANANSDLVVVLLHSGYEYIEAPSPAQKSAARAAIDAGADLVIGHHAHVLQGIEFRDNSAIVYGLGNFAFEIDGDPTTMILNVWLDSDGVRQLELVPAVIERGGPPRLATAPESREIRDRVYRLSAMLDGAP